MKNFFLLLCGLCLLAGCKTSYDVTLNNGNKISGVTKPVLDSSTGQYRFKMADGREMKVSSGHVKTIEPQGESSAPNFTPPKPKK